MRILFLLLAILSVSNIYAQKDFEGTIKYLLTSPNSKYEEEETDKKQDSIFITILFSQGKLKIMPGKKEDIVILLDSASVYTLDAEGKHYEIKKLIRYKSLQPAQQEIIQGYTTTPQALMSTIRSSTVGFSQVWLADSLQFSMPAYFEGNDELLMIKNNKIILKGIIAVPDYNFNSDEEKTSDSMQEQNIATLLAIDVKPGAINAAEFMIPDGYTKYENVFAADTASTVSMPDTLVAVVDSASVVAPAKQIAPAKKKPTQAPVKTKTASKPPARKP
jgi:hypothetical protein